MGVEGIRWQKRVMGVSPRFCWAIDLCGTHEQMPQICKGLGLEGLIYTGVIQPVKPSSGQRLPTVHEFSLLSFVWLC